MQKIIYLDNNATTELDPLVTSAMLEELKAPPSNPSSQHSLGRQAKNRLLKARETIASYCGVKSKEIIFTSSGTESMNFLIQGFCTSHHAFHVVSSKIEHSCVEKTLLELEKKGVSVSFLKPETDGKVSLENIEKAITQNTKLLVFSAINGETGVKQDIEKISELALKYGISLIVDGVALIGKEPFKISPGISAMGFSGHKFHGPKGVGFVFLRSSKKFPALLLGGGQESGLRSGTENLPCIVGLAKAIELLEKIPTSTLELRNYFEKNLLEKFPFIEVNGGESQRITNVSNLAFMGVDGETLLIQLDLQGICASHGSACSSGALEPSRILTEMGLSRERVKSSVRFSLSRFTTKEEIDHVIYILTQIIPKLKKT